MDLKKVYENTTKITKQEWDAMMAETTDTVVVIKQKHVANCAISESLKKIMCSETMFDGITFGGNWKQVEMQKCVFKNCIFQQVMGTGISFIGSVFTDCDFISARIPRTDFTKCTFQNVQITDCDFNRTNFSLSNYETIKVCNSKIDNTLLEEKAKQVKARNDDVRKRLLRTYQAVEQILMLGTDSFEEHESLQHATSQLHDFITAQSAKMDDTNDLQKMDANELEYRIREHEKVVDSPVKISEIPVIDLSQFDFSGYNFQEHNLSCIDFSHSCLRNCCFAGCDLSGCDFSFCDLSGAIMFHAHFNQVNFEGAMLDDLILDNKNKEAFVKAGILTESKDKAGDYM